MKTRLIYLLTQKSNVCIETFKPVSLECTKILDIEYLNPISHMLFWDPAYI